MIIGITGKIGTGKSHVVKYLKKQLRFDVIDADKIKFEVTKKPEIHNKLLKTFRSKILHRNGTIDRTKLMIQTAKNPIHLKVLSEYVDLEVGNEIKKIIEENESNYIIESTDPISQGIDKMFDLSVLIVTSKRFAYQRLLRKYPKDVVDNLWEFQKNVKNYDYVIENTGKIQELKDDVNHLIAEMAKPKSD